MPIGYRLPPQPHDPRRPPQVNDSSFVGYNQNRPQPSMGSQGLFGSMGGNFHMPSWLQGIIGNAGFGGIFGQGQSPGAAQPQTPASPPMFSNFGATAGRGGMAAFPQQGLAGLSQANPSPQPYAIHSNPSAPGLSQAGAAAPRNPSAGSSTSYGVDPAIASILGQANGSASSQQQFPVNQSFMNSYKPGGSNYNSYMGNPSVMAEGNPQQAYQQTGNAYWLGPQEAAQQLYGLASAQGKPPNQNLSSTGLGFTPFQNNTYGLQNNQFNPNAVGWGGSVAR